MDDFIGRDAEQVLLYLGQAVKVAEATPDDHPQIGQEQDQEYSVTFGSHRELLENQLSEVLRPVEVRLRGADGVPAQEMGMGSQIAAFVEIAPLRGAPGEDQQGV